MFKCIALLILRALFNDLEDPVMMSSASDLRWLPAMAMCLCECAKIFVTMLFPYLFDIYVYIPDRRYIKLVAHLYWPTNYFIVSI